VNREQWLDAAVDLFREHFKQAGIKLPKKIQASVGWPSFAMKSAVIAESWPKKVSKDNTSHIFISPKLSDPVEVLSTLAHELVHVSLDCEGGHMHDFQKRARAIGLQSPWVSPNGTWEFIVKMGDWSVQLGKYPHSGFKQRSDAYGKPATTYLIKIWCDNCGYVARTTEKWIQKGLPICPCGTQMVTK
jgi:hypothetical protein